MALAAILFGALFALQGGMVSTSEYRAMQSDVRALHDSLAILTERRVAAERAWLDLRDDPVAQDAEARRRYGVVSRGEWAYIVIDGAEGRDSTVVDDR